MTVGPRDWPHDTRRGPVGIQILLARLCEILAGNADSNHPRLKAVDFAPWLIDYLTEGMPDLPDLVAVMVDRKLTPGAVVQLISDCDDMPPTGPDFVEAEITLNHLVDIMARMHISPAGVVALIAET